MAPPEHTFPISELEQRVHGVTKNFKEKSRKLPKDFDLKKDCELFELVQYSCTTVDQVYEKKKNNPLAPTRMECFPFVRLFRRCSQGENTFHVETTAWEGEHAWKPPGTTTSTSRNRGQSTVSKDEAAFAKYGSYFWSAK